MWKLIFLFLNIYSLAEAFRSTSICCRETRSSDCTRNCRKLLRRASYQPTHKRRLSRRLLTDIVNTCPRSEVQFWHCLEDSQMWKDFRVASEKKPKNHAVCCKEATHVSCELQCLATRNVTKLQNENCDAVREPKFAQCVFKVQASKSCCHDTHNLECKRACIHYFKDTGSGTVLTRKAEVESKCGKKSKQYQCVVDQSDYGSVIQDLTKCCSSSGTSKQCEGACKKTLRNSVNLSVMFSSLDEPCGHFDLKTPIYQCFMDLATNTQSQETEETTDIVDPGFTSRTSRVVTSFKGQCCARAKSQKCHRWCSETISSPNLMGLWEMYLSCIQDPKEVKLSTCMSDILEPCEIGGKPEMKFCTNFNNRPLELFRRCDRFGDSAARKLHRYWSDGIVRVLNYNLVFKNISTCEPEKFKAMACLLAVKPCSHHAPQKQVCRSDCEFMLDKCLDKQYTSLDVSVNKVCAAILPNNNQTGCISVSDYATKPSPAAKKTNEVTLPCKDNPCSNDEMCLINKACDQRIDPTCKNYICVRGCPVSRKNELIIPIGQYAKLSVDEEGKDCYQVCECKIDLTEDIPHTYFSNCRQFNCDRKQNCTLKTKILNDGDVISQDCNTCICNDGDLICSQKNCPTIILGHNTDRARRHHVPMNNNSTLPCECSNVYNPICGANGMTYPNACLAKCGFMNTRDLYVGDCQAVDPCDPHRCMHGLTCTPKRRVCLSSSRCPQYTCSLETSERYHVTSSLCTEEKSPVCGFDAVTYRNKCYAEKAGTGIDYYGPCLSKKYPSIAIRNDRCKKIKCPDIKESNCILIIPLGACCPVCGSILRILYSQKDLLRHQNYISYEPITVVDVVKVLRQLLKVRECSLYGHRTVEGDIMMLLTVSTEQPTYAQIHACKTEAERLNKYINNRSPVVAANYYLSIMKACTLESPSQAELSETVVSASRTLYRDSTIWTIVLLCSLVNTILIR